MNAGIKPAIHIGGGSGMDGWSSFNLGHSIEVVDIICNLLDISVHFGGVGGPLSCCRSAGVYHIELGDLLSHCWFGGDTTLAQAAMSVERGDPKDALSFGTLK